MKFLSIVASERKKGNSDLLGKLATMEVKNNKIDAEVIYLKDYKIEECQGCMNCVFNKKKCKIDDDLYKFLDKINSADILFLVAPTYVISIPGKLKIIMDRFLAIYDETKQLRIRPAISVGVAALPDWYQFQLPMMNLFLLALGFSVINSFIIYGAGPGEILLADNLDKILSSVKNLCQNPRIKEYKSQISSYCPIDYCNLFERIENNKYRCPVCLTPCVLQEKGFYFDEKDLNNHRWTPHKLKEHFENWILQTKPRFKQNLRAIYNKKKELNIE